MTQKDKVMRVNLTEILYYLKLIAWMIAGIASLLYFMKFFYEANPPFDSILPVILYWMVLWILYKLNGINNDTK